MRFSLLATLALGVSAVSIEERQSAACRASSGISSERASQVVRKFRKAAIFPGILKRFQPVVEVGVDYSTTAVDLGTELSTTETLAEPTITFTSEPGFPPARTNYTILMFDPDAPSPDQPLLRSFLHLISTNNRPSCVRNADANAMTVAPYMAPTPLSAPVHRYIFLVCRQPPGEFTPEISPVVLASRGMFDAKEFIAQNGLTVLGGNYFVQGLSSLGEGN